MSKVFLIASLPVVLAIGLILTGCSNQQPGLQPSAAPETAQNQPAATGHEGHEGHENAGLEQGEPGHAEHSGHAEHGEYEEELSQLSAADRVLAEKQKLCPVSGQPLGSMGKPYKVTVNGQDVFLCCQGCEGKIKGSPEKYLAKLPK